MNETFCTVEEANAYFEYRLDAGDWFTQWQEVTAEPVPSVTVRDNEGNLQTLELQNIDDVISIGVTPTPDPNDPSVIDRRLKALVTATRTINRLGFAGTKTDSSQALEFPRNSENTIPDAIKHACAEEALMLLRGKNPENEIRNLKVQAMSFITAKVMQDTNYIPPYLKAGLVSYQAWLYLMPYLVDSRSVRIVRA